MIAERQQQYSRIGMGFGETKIASRFLLPHSHIGRILFNLARAASFCFTTGSFN
jgi:hypothetical protein